MSVFIYPLTKVVPEYTKWQLAIPSFIMFALSIGWSAISTPLVNTLNAIGQINKSLKLMIIWTVLTWVLTPILIWQFGFNGVALAALAISFSSFLAIREVKKICPIDVWGNLKVQLAASVLMALVGVMGIEKWSQSLSWFLLGGLFSGLIYALAVFVLGKKQLFAEITSLKANK